MKISNKKNQKQKSICMECEKNEEHIAGANICFECKERTGIFWHSPAHSKPRHPHN